MSTTEALIIHNGHFNEEEDNNKDVQVQCDSEYLYFEPNLSSMSQEDFVELWVWVNKQLDREG
jgi:hypothetical protein